MAALEHKLKLPDDVVLTITQSKDSSVLLREYIQQYSFVSGFQINKERKPKIFRTLAKEEKQYVESSNT